MRSHLNKLGCRVSVRDEGLALVLDNPKLCLPTFQLPHQSLHTETEDWNMDMVDWVKDKLTIQVFLQLEETLHYYYFTKIAKYMYSVLLLFHEDYFYSYSNNYYQCYY